MYVCLDTVIMYKHFITPVFSLLHLIFSSNGQLILRQRATEISPGHYPMDLVCCFIYTCNEKWNSEKRISARTLHYTSAW